MSRLDPIKILETESARRALLVSGAVGQLKRAKRSQDALDRAHLAIAACTMPDWCDDTPPHEPSP